MAHISVLLNELVYYLKPKPGDVILDGTFGGGGHSLAICKALGKKGLIVGLDQDEGIVKRWNTEKETQDAGCQIYLVNENFRNLDKVAELLEIKELDGAVFDFGLNSQQLDESGRGFTFQKNEPLLMTFKSKPDESDLTARDIVNEWAEQEIANVIYEYGEERYSRRIAKGIVEERKKKPIETTFALTQIIRDSVPATYRNNKRINCCTKTFQALRIAVNDELETLKEGIQKAWDLLKPEGRIVVISFHSLEDRIVKNFFRDKKKEKEGRVLTKKPVTSSDEEKKANPRSRSAKLRAIERTN